LLCFFPFVNLFGQLLHFPIGAQLLVLTWIWVSLYRGEFMNDQEYNIGQLVDKALMDFPQYPVPERLFEVIMNRIET